MAINEVFVVFLCHFSSVTFLLLHCVNSVAAAAGETPIIYYSKYHEERSFSKFIKTEFYWNFFNHFHNNKRESLHSPECQRNKKKNKKKKTINTKWIVWIVCCVAAAAVTTVAAATNTAVHYLNYRIWMYLWSVGWYYALFGRKRFAFIWQNDIYNTHKSSK